MNAYVYTKPEPGLWTVGFYAPSGQWEPESDHTSEDAASKRVHYLNGGTDEALKAEIERLKKQIAQMVEEDMEERRCL